MKNIGIVISIIAILISSITTLYFFEESSNLNYKLQKIKESQEEKVLTLNLKISKLNASLNKLNAEFNETILSQKSQIEYQQEKISNLSKSLNEFETELKSKIEWIKSNANIENVSEYTTTKNLIYKCVSDEINLGCISYLIFDKEGMKYIPDIKEGTNDTLYNLSEIYQHGGGDCEDLSLLFAATVRYAMDKYNLSKFNGWIDGNSMYKIYSTSTEYWYMKDAKEVDFQAKYVYVTCGEIYNQSSGHCIVSFCKNKINNASELYNCTNVEPQEYGKIVKIKGPISLYISSDDLCQSDTKIKCFSDFKVI